MENTFSSPKNPSIRNQIKKIPDRWVILTQIWLRVFANTANRNCTDCLWYGPWALGFSKHSFRRTLERKWKYTQAKKYTQPQEVRNVKHLISLSLKMDSDFRQCVPSPSPIGYHLNREGRSGTTDDFTTSFLHFLCSPSPSGTWRTPGLSIPCCCPLTSSSVCFVCFSLSLCFVRWFRRDLMNGKHVRTNSVCLSLRWSGGLCVARLLAGSWHGLPRW